MVSKIAHQRTSRYENGKEPTESKKDRNIGFMIVTFCSKNEPGQGGLFHKLCRKQDGRDSISLIPNRN
jgi:hypothetical protein